MIRAGMAALLTLASGGDGADKGKPEQPQLQLTGTITFHQQIIIVRTRGTVAVLMPPPAELSAASLLPL